MGQNHDESPVSNDTDKSLPDETDPFIALSAEDIFAEIKYQNTPNNHKYRLRCKRGWIPDFHEQIDKGVNSFVLEVAASSPLDTKIKANGEIKPNTQSNPSSGYDGISKEHDTVWRVEVGLEFRKHSTGSDLWDAALVLAHYLPVAHPPPPLLFDESKNETNTWLRNKCVVELGSGVGAVGILASKMGARQVWMTDLSPNLELIKRNTERNGEEAICVDWNPEHDSCGKPERKEESLTSPTVRIAPLDWTSSMLPSGLGPGSADVIIGSDIFLPFAPELLHPICHTIHKLLADPNQLHPQGGIAYIAYEERFDCSPFFHEAERIGLEVVVVNEEDLHHIYRDSGRIFVLKIRRKESAAATEF